MAVIGQVVGVVSGPFTGQRGIVVGPSPNDAEAWVINVMGSPNARIMGSPIATAVNWKDLRVVPQDWITTTRTSRFNQVAMLTCFQAPNLLQAVVPFDPTMIHRDTPPRSKEVYSFWGEAVFSYMWQQLQKQLNTQRKRGTLWRFQHQQPQAGIVYCDGTKAEQESAMASRRSAPGSSWWPMLYVFDLDGRMLMVYCQAQAVNGARVWTTHPTRVAKLPGATNDLFNEIAAPIAPEPPIIVCTP